MNEPPGNDTEIIGDTEIAGFHPLWVSYPERQSLLFKYLLV